MREAKQQITNSRDAGRFRGFSCLWPDALQGLQRDV
jgi:hypothetical protein